MNDESPRIEPVRTFLMELQDEICAALEKIDGEAKFRREEFPSGEGTTRPRCLERGAVLERAAVNFSHSKKDRLPAAATERHPELQGRGFEAVSVSLITHPRNPFAPTSHMNVRFFLAEDPPREPVWWFGGGFDLTPYYGFEEDARHWHRTARAACDPFGADLYPELKEACDRYFFLPHRQEPRGIGGVFFDDWNEPGFEASYGLMRSVGSHYLPAYLPILERRLVHPYEEKHRQWQLYRRGRYVEFNLAYDRGTRFGLQSGARAESLLASMPPLVRWEYDLEPEPGTEEARLHEDFLRPRDWANEGDSC